MQARNASATTGPVPPPAPADPMSNDRPDTADELAADRALVRCCLEDPREGVPRLVGRFENLVFGVCLRALRHRHDAEDVAQEVFLRAVRSLRRWDGERPLRPWLVTIAANRCRTHLSRGRNRPVPVEFVDDVADRRPAEGDAGEVRAALQDALERLRPEYQQVFLLFHEQGMNYQQMSETLGRPVGTLKTWLHRARAALYADLQERGLTPEDPP